MVKEGTAEGQSEPALELPELLDVARSLARAQFVSQFPYPVLLATGVASAENVSKFYTQVASAQQQQPVFNEIPDIRVLPVRKAKESTYGDRISVGRTRRNDIRLPHASVSKFHAYFMQQDDGKWAVIDAGSRNGTFVDNEQLEERSPYVLGDRVVVTFGQHSLRFHQAADFYQILMNLDATLNRAPAK